MLWMLILGCAPPPLADSDLPNISFIFPESRTDVTVCPDLMVTVDIDNWDIVVFDEDQEPEEAARRGHWHLRDAGGDYLSIVTEDWVPISLEGDFSEPTLTVITAHLANHNHNELDLATYPTATATAEFMVGATEDCVGGGSGGMDTGVGY